MAKIEKVVCDCCRREITGEEHHAKLVLPILKQGEGIEDLRLITKEMDICNVCACEIASAYYKQARKYGYSGLRAFCMEVDDG